MMVSELPKVNGDQKCFPEPTSGFPLESTAINAAKAMGDLTRRLQLVTRRTVNRQMFEGLQWEKIGTYLFECQVFKFFGENSKGEKRDKGGGLSREREGGREREGTRGWGFQRGGRILILFPLFQIARKGRK